MDRSIEIREYESSDRNRLIDLWKLVFGNAQDHNNPEQSLERKLKTDCDLVMVATKDGIVVGTVMGGYDGHRGWVYSLAVHPEWCRNGIGTSLIRCLEEKLITKGCPKLNLQIRSSNERVISFYEKIGFQIEERVSMGKHLTE